VRIQRRSKGRHRPCSQYRSSLANQAIRLQGASTTTLSTSCLIDIHGRADAAAPVAEENSDDASDTMSRRTRVGGAVAVGFGTAGEANAGSTSDAARMNADRDCIVDRCEVQTAWRAFRLSCQPSFYEHHGGYFWIACAMTSTNRVTPCSSLSPNSEPERIIGTTSARGFCCETS
jgi:hypothetical protein